MGVFEWFGISNGEAVVRHRGEGHVFRFKPQAAGDWSDLQPGRVETGVASFDQPEDHAPAARAEAMSHVHLWLETCLA